PLYVASIDSPDERVYLLDSESTNVAYSHGHILFLRGTTLMAQPFDAGRRALTGEAFPVAEEIQRQGLTPPLGVFSASEDGVLVYQAGADASNGTRLSWLDRSGRLLRSVGELARYGEVVLSVDGTRAAVGVTTAEGTDLWTVDLDR